jgi:hypothetical protein
MIDISKSITIRTYPLRAIPDFPNYFISEYGEVVSFYRRIMWENGKRGSITKIFTTPQYLLEPHLNSDNYHDVFIKAKNNKQKIRLIHQLVLESFGYLKPFKEAEVRHLDGNRINNHISNLKWGTSAENGEDLRRHGNIAGIKNPAAKLKEEDVRFIREHKEYLIEDLMKKYNVSKSAIVQARNRRTFKNLA